MPMPTDIRFGCQTFTWEMNGAGSETPDAMVDAIAAAGYAGIEITDNMIGDYRGKPAAFGALLKRHRLEFVAYTISSPTGFTVAADRHADLAAVDDALDFLSHFPRTLLTLGSATKFGTATVDQMFETAAEIYNAAGRRGKQRGVRVGVHASSHENTLLFSEADYSRILDLTDPTLVGWVPDTGHMLKGAHDLLRMLRRYADRINYLHVKDVDREGTWTMLGKGMTDMVELCSFANSALQPSPWIVMEEESIEASRGPAKAIATNFATLKKLLSEA